MFHASVILRREIWLSFRLLSCEIYIESSDDSSSLHVSKRLLNLNMAHASFLNVISALVLDYCLFFSTLWIPFDTIQSLN